MSSLVKSNKNLLFEDIDEDDDFTTVLHYASDFG